MSITSTTPITPASYKPSNPEIAMVEAFSENGKNVATGTRGKTENEVEAEVKAYVSQLKEKNVPTDSWMLPSKRYYSDKDYQKNHYKGILPFLLGQTKTVKAITHLVNEGASPWMVSYIKSEDAHNRSEYHEAEALGRYPMTGSLGYYMNNESIQVRKMILKGSLKHIKDQDIVAFMKALHEGYESQVKNSSKTAKGVLGSSDKEAKDAAGIIQANSTELLEVVNRITDEASLKKTKKNIESIVKDASERMAVKQDKANAVVNPEKLKKQMPADERGRAGALIYLCQNHGSDDELLRVAFEATPWLEQKPMCASLKLPKVGGVLQAALRSQNMTAIHFLEKCGANIWLASAQEGVGNACEWVSSACLYRCNDETPQEYYNILGRMLFMGSFLDGAEDPKGRCLELARAVHKEHSKSSSNHYYHHNYPDRIARLISALEVLTLEEVIANLPAATEPAVKQRRSL